MKMSRLLELPKRNYEEAIAALAKSNVSSIEIEKILNIILDHQRLAQIRDKVIAEQRLQAEGIFNIEAATEGAENKSALELVTESLVTVEPEEFEKLTDTDSHDVDSLTEQVDPETTLQRGKRALELGECHHHLLKEEEKLCPCCGKKMVKARERKATIVYASKLLLTRTDYAETVHCESCDVTHSAEMSSAVNETIGRYHYSAVANLAALRYLYGLASYRMEEYSRNVGLKITDSTQWKLFEDAASMLRGFVNYLTEEAANAPVCHTDDTYQLIHELVSEIEQAQWDALAKGKNPNTVRSGIKTNNFTAVHPQGKIVLFRSGLHHAGEILAKNLEMRTTEESLVVMMDALSANTSKLNEKSKEQVKVANCNAHVVRKFRELADSEMAIAKELRLNDAKVSEEIDYFLRGYKRVFGFEKQTKSLNPHERLLFHQKNSLPIMEGMLERTQKLFANKKVEPNSDLGRVYQYLVNHWHELTAFCRESGAPLDNNTAERALKGAIRHRRNSLFFKNQLGAAVGDILTSILMTAKENGLNPVEYLQDLLTYREAWKQNPSDWLPWNYSETKSQLQTPAQS